MHGYRYTFLGGLAVGYVVGTRAGRERYEQLKRLARSAAENPAVQQAAGALQAQATGAIKSATGKVTQSAKQKVGERVPGLRHRGDGDSANGNPADAAQQAAAHTTES
jgi:hypothetical protein